MLFFFVECLYGYHILSFNFVQNKYMLGFVMYLFRYLFVVDQKTTTAVIKSLQRIDGDHEYTAIDMLVPITELT